MTADSSSVGVPDVTVAILTWNGERYLDDVLTALEAQRYEGGLDVLVIDSGSTDRTLEIVAAHPSVRLHEIPHQEFSHGRTRNLAAQLATGEIVAYLTHDAVPLGEHWLTALISPLIEDESVAAVLGRQVARPSAPPLLKYDIDRVFDRLGPRGAATVYFLTDTMNDYTRRLATFYSDVCSAARRDILLHEIPYRDVEYAEDQVFGREVIEAGYGKAYAADAVVEHSNDGTMLEFGARISADLIGLRRIGATVAPLSRFGAFKQWVKWSLADSARVIADRDYRLARKMYWLVVNPVFHAVKWSNYRRASIEQL